MDLTFLWLFENYQAVTSVILCGTAETGLPYGPRDGCWHANVRELKSEVTDQATTIILCVSPMTTAHHYLLVERK